MTHPLLDPLNQTYAGLHTTKEDAFWTAYMGLASDATAARAELDSHEVALQRFLQDPARLQEVRQALAAGGLDERAQVALKGWEATFTAHAIDSEQGRADYEEIVAAEGALAGARGEMALGYQDPQQGFTAASSVKLGTMLISETDGALRKAAWEGLRSIEGHVLEHGFLDVVRRRNQLGRMLGGEDFYDWKVKRVEGMDKAELFALLDELEAQTRDAAQRALDELRSTAGADQVTPWNIRYLVRGDVTREQDPFFPFEAAVTRWGQSFAALGIDYRGAQMVLDLVDRKGKYENGFMHGPEVAWSEDGVFHPARIQFTANAIPGMIGSGHRATQTLFHEGGHAAHFANIDMPAPCFGQEFAPTSVAFAETQSMFLDSLLGDADWQLRYARDLQGSAIPWELVEKGIQASQPFAAWNARAMLAVCYAERAIYELPEDQLTPEGVRTAIRREEKRLLFMESPRPVLSVPHLLAGESSAYYHGYVLAEMGVYQTRDFFLGRDGHLMDNPKIGPQLREAYWRPGNSRGCSEMIQGLTGSPMSAGAYATHLNHTVEQALTEAKQAADRAADVAPFAGDVQLDASIRIAHGHETVAELAPGGDFEAFGQAFGSWIANQHQERAPSQ